MAPSSEREAINSLICQWQEAIEFFSNRRRHERERVVARAFLRAVGESYVEGEFVVGPSEPIDVSYREARFQIMELPGERGRLDEFRERLRRARLAKRLIDVGEPWSSSKPMSLAEAVRAVAIQLEPKSRKYGAVGCAELDALVYINIPGRHLHPELEEASVEDHGLKQQGWRSVSVLAPPYGFVAFASAQAPDLLKNKAGKVLQCAGPDVALVNVRRISETFALDGCRITLNLAP